jgi:hypothetical protein
MLFKLKMMFLTMFSFLSSFFGFSASPLKIQANGFVTFVALGLALASTSAFGAPIAAPDTADIMTSITNVFGAVLAVTVVIFGFKKVKSLL